ncbi:dephospho-CoA kinase [Flavobacterium sp. ZS1P70]|uniref:Dephospho-CoA kinase n=1 Tax=Flavobacterium zhoui TaxID=3230414 RepID=A0ABW6I4F0_9FLAO
MTKIIGLTGGIGSGKTTIANEFLSLGVPVYIADDEARKLMQSLEVINAIRTVFGNTVFENDTLKRDELAEIVFSNPEKLEQLNAIVHPSVKKHFKEWLLNHKDAPFVIYEAAILFESGGYINCDLIISVIAPLETRIQRVIDRDKTTREQVLKRINMQWNDEKRISKSDFVIKNTNIEETKSEIVKILKLLKIKQNVT